ncbi:uncharacterized protein LOC143287581 isoform X3 [Babylonia areolata]|uniref:uncharacterized protein LOC143287581 isoform X3 n=1 Tax=Babylonia areolata TaxID=304850 RepID=UPI003FD5C1DB
MLLENSPAGSALRLSNMAAAAKLHRQADVRDAVGDADDSLSAVGRRKKDNQTPKPRKRVEAPEDRPPAPMQEKATKNVPSEALRKLKKHRQDDVRLTKRQLRLQRQWKRDPQRMQKLRHKFVEQCKRYFGVPYARKYWAKGTPEHKAPLFLDCCGLVRQVMRDLERDFGFRIGPWNQAYMFDTLPIVLTESQMRPGDLVFMTGTYTNGKHKKQRHNMLHVEVWLGEGGKTIGARWNKGKVQVFDSYRFQPTSFTNEQYLFRSIDTWLMGICKSYCDKHKWGVSSYHQRNKKSPVFLPEQLNLSLQDQKAGDDDDDDDNDNDKGGDGDKGMVGTGRSGVGGRGSGTPPSSVSLARQDVTGRGGKKRRSKKGRKALSLEMRKLLAHGLRPPPPPPLPLPANSKGCAVVSRHSFLPQATKTALLRLEDRLDNLVARNRHAGGAGDAPRRPLNGGGPAPPNPQRLVKGTATTSSVSSSTSSSSVTPLLMMTRRGRGGGVGWTVAARPATSFDVFGGQGTAGSGGGAAAASSSSGGRPGAAGTAGTGVQLRCPVIGDCNAQPMQYVPNAMPKRYGSPLLVCRGAAHSPSPRPPGLQQPRTPKWFVDTTPTRPGADAEVHGSTPPTPPPSAPPQPPSTTTQKKGLTGERTPSTRRPPLFVGGGGVGVRSREGGVGGLVTRGALSVVGSGSVGGGMMLRKNKSCSDLEMLSTKTKPRPAPRGGVVGGGGGGGTPGLVVGGGRQTPGGPYWRSNGSRGSHGSDGRSHGDPDSRTSSIGPPLAVWRPVAPGPLNKPLSFSAQFLQEVRDYSPSSPSLAATCCTEEEEEEEEEVEEKMNSGSDGETSMACDWDGCWSEDCSEEEEGEGEDAEEQEELDTDEELEGYCVLQYAMEDDDEDEDEMDTDDCRDDNDDNESEEEEEVDDDGDDDGVDDLAGATLSFTYRSDWNVSESQSFAATPTTNHPHHHYHHLQTPRSSSSSIFPLTPQTPDLARRTPNSLAGRSPVPRSSPLPFFRRDPGLARQELPRIPAASPYLRGHSNRSNSNNSCSNSNCNNNSSSNSNNNCNDNFNNNSDNPTDSPNDNPKDSPNDNPKDNPEDNPKDSISDSPVARRSHKAGRSRSAAPAGHRKKFSPGFSSTTTSPTSPPGTSRPSTSGGVPRGVPRGWASPELRFRMTKRKAGSLPCGGGRQGSEEGVTTSAGLTHSGEEEREVVAAAAVGSGSSLEEQDAGTSRVAVTVAAHDADADADDDDDDDDDDDGDAPVDGDEKSGGGGGGGGGGAARGGEPSESEQGGGEETGAEGVGEGAGGRSGGRRGGKRTPGGRPTKLPACSLPANMTPTFFVGGGNGVALVEGPLLALGWKRTMDKYDERFKLKWVECKSKINYTAFKEGEQLVNHIPNCKLLTNKMGLLSSLQEYERVTLATKGRPPRLKMADFVPETYKLDEKVDRATFLGLYQEGEIWICKPVGMNQGKGIFLLRSRQEIDNLLAERDAKREVNKHSTRMPMIRIVQRYISNPLLLDGRKFDIRAYMLIASTVPYLVLFHQGYIRLSCLKYDGDDTNLTTHLTNQYVQKKDPNYKEVKEDTAWSMDKFNDYVNTNYAEEKGVEQDWVFNTMTKQMQRIMLHCFNSVKHKLQCKMGYFDLYGLDFMIDTDMKVWLIEVNVNPALHINCDALKEVIPGVVEETLHLSIEAFEKSRKNQPLMPMQSLKGFQVLHCGTPLFNVATRQTRSVSPAKGDNPERTRAAQTAHAHGRFQSPPRALPRMSVSTTQVQVAPSASSSQTNTTAGTRSSQQTSLPDISHSNTNANQSTSSSKPASTTTTTTASAGQSAVVRNVTTTTGQPSSVTSTTTVTKTAASASGSKPSTAGPSSAVSTPKTSSTAVSHKTGSTAAPSTTTTTTTTPGSRPSVPPSTTSLRQPAPMAEVKMGGEDIRLKMTHAASASSRRHRDKPDRGN